MDLDKHSTHAINMSCIRRHSGIDNSLLLNESNPCKCPPFAISALRIMKFIISAVLVPLIVCNFYNVIITGVEALPMMMNIEPYDDECFFLKVPSSPKPKAKILTGSYEMYDEVSSDRVSAVPLLVYILEVTRRNKPNDNANLPNNEKILWRSVPNESKGSFRVPITSIQRGYWLCFQNSNHSPDNPDPEQEHPDHVIRTIGFDYNVDSIIPDTKPSPLLYTTDHTDEWQDKATSVQREIRQLMTHRDYMHMREADHRKLVEYTFDDIMSWTIVETFCVVLVAIGQVMYFRRFVEKKQRY